MKGKDQKTLDSVGQAELPPELKLFDKPAGFEQHHVNILAFTLCHISFVYYVFYLLPYGHVPKTTVLLGLLYAYWTAFGITAGAHRHWTHRAFKANLPLRILMMLAQTASFQYPLFKWCSEHRVHHKYSDTDADPHNSKRGFWFSHILHLCQPKNEQVMEKLKTIDLSDLIADPIVRFQSKYYYPLFLLMHYMVPMTLCHLMYPEMSLLHLWVWNESRWCYMLHVTFSVNSFAHMWGNKPFDQNICSTENKLVSFFASGEGWHNYHHTFPWDYRTAELGTFYNLTTFLLNGFAWIGWAYDLKTVSHTMLQNRIRRTGDGSHQLYGVYENGKKEKLEETVSEPYWGWEDKNLKKEDRKLTEILFQSTL